eukprot:CAMPEP_0178431946 /NCGR_PEP_ID=MMETSP0689_2-20121128/32124_1 /TAXON_ID=160604 /ORGANISM="Amphidinium massartii, Strain CS-259" /LENGTH=295 /DNA_ID=CAMNT_0020053903 /DNA_START=20 /DNA_END=903 /DNA_ORIENTATION=+
MVETHSGEAPLPHAFPVSGWDPRFPVKVKNTFISIDDQFGDGEEKPRRQQSEPASAQVNQATRKNGALMCGVSESTATSSDGGLDGSGRTESGDSERLAPFEHDEDEELEELCDSGEQAVWEQWGRITTEDVWESWQGQTHLYSVPENAPSQPMPSEAESSPQRKLNAEAQEFLPARAAPEASVYDVGEDKEKFDRDADGSNDASNRAGRRRRRRGTHSLIDLAKQQRAALEAGWQMQHAEAAASGAAQAQQGGRLCPHCGGRVQSTFKFCQFCGKPLVTQVAVLVPSVPPTMAS